MNSNVLFIFKKVRKKMNSHNCIKNRLAILLLLSLFCFVITGCSHKLSGKYTSQTSSYTIEFSDDSFVLYNDNFSYDGIFYWDKDDNQYILELNRNYWIQGITHFIATEDNGDLIVSGVGYGNEIGVKFDNERFARQE